MSEELAFLHGLLANPEDDTLRLVYADWLEERGDPRAAFVRAEVEWHRTEPDARTRRQRERLHQARAGFDARWLTQMDRPSPGWRLVRTKPTPKTYGKAIPAFIHNGSYFLSTVDVYADGAINCWGFVDVDLFRDKLAQGWVVPEARIGGILNIHNLGQARVLSAHWECSRSDIKHQVMDALRELNPMREGLLNMQGNATEIRKGGRYAKLGLVNGKPYRVSPTGDEILGGELPVLEVVPDGYRLRRWLIYADGLSQLGYANELRPLEAVAEMFEQKKLVLSVPEGAWVTLDGLGRFQAGEGYWSTKSTERLREAADILDQLNGRPGAVQRCIEAHQAYRSDPTREQRLVLRRAYADVPEHLRRFCGDMDSKDGPIRSILSRFASEDEPE